MGSAKLSRLEFTDLIHYGIKENGVDISNVNQLEIHSILNDYEMFCNHLTEAYVKGELDTFKRAACLMVSINRGRLSHNKKINASIAIDAAHKMCEKPHWNLGENFDIPKKLEEVDFKENFKENIDVYNTSKNMMLASLLYEHGHPICYNLNLELLYQVALILKHKEHPTKEKEEETMGYQKRNKMLNLFKRNIIDK